ASDEPFGIEIANGIPFPVGGSGDKRRSSLESCQMALDDELAAYSIPVAHGRCTSDFHFRQEGILALNWPGTDALTRRLVNVVVGFNDNVFVIRGVHKDGLLLFSHLARRVGTRPPAARFLSVSSAAWRLIWRVVAWVQSAGGDLGRSGRGGSLLQGAPRHALGRVALEVRA